MRPTHDDAVVLARLSYDPKKAESIWWISREPEADTVIINPMGDIKAACSTSCSPFKGITKQSISSSLAISSNLANNEGIHVSEAV